MYSDTLRHYYLMVYCIVYLSRDFHSFPFVCCFFVGTLNDLAVMLRHFLIPIRLRCDLREQFICSIFCFEVPFPRHRSFGWPFSGCYSGTFFFSICDECSSWGSSTAMLLVGELHSDAALGGAMRLPLCLSCDLFGFVTCATIFLLKTVD